MPRRPKIAHFSLRLISTSIAGRCSDWARMHVVWLPLALSQCSCLDIIFPLHQTVNFVCVLVWGFLCCNLLNGAWTKKAEWFGNFIPSSRADLKRGLGQATADLLSLTFTGGNDIHLCISRSCSAVVWMHRVDGPTGPAVTSCSGYSGVLLNHFLYIFIVPLPGQMDLKFIVLRNWIPLFILYGGFSPPIFFFLLFFFFFSMGLSNLIKDSISWNVHIGKWQTAEASRGGQAHEPAVGERKNEATVK